MNTDHTIVPGHGRCAADRPSAPIRATLVAWAVAVAVVLPVAPHARASDGARAFKSACGPCHSTNQVHRIGPSLVGIVGRVSGTLPSFDYSPALKKAAVTWDATLLERFLESPSSVVAGTRMSYPGLSDVDKRKAIVGFITTLRAP